MIQFDKHICTYIVRCARTLVFVMCALAMFPQLVSADFDPNNRTCKSTQDQCLSDWVQWRDWLSGVQASHGDTEVNGRKISEYSVEFIGVGPNGDYSSPCEQVSAGQEYCYVLDEDLIDDISEATGEEPDAPTASSTVDQSGVSVKNYGEQTCISGKGDRVSEVCYEMVAAADEIKEGCSLNTELSGNGSNDVVYCYTPQEYGLGLVCGREFSVSPGQTEINENTSVAAQRSLTQCQVRRSAYEPYNDNVPECGVVNNSKLDVDVDWIPISGVGVDVYRDEYASFCFDATGLVQASDEEIEAAEDRYTQQRLREIELANLEARRNLNTGAIQRTLQMREIGSLVQCDGAATYDDRVSSTGGVDGVCDWDELVALANRLIEFLIQLAAVIVVIVIVIAGFKMVTANGNVKAFSEASSTLGRAIGGLILILLAWLIVNTVMNILLSDEFQGEEVIDVLGSDNNQ